MSKSGIYEMFLFLLFFFMTVSFTSMAVWHYHHPPPVIEPVSKFQIYVALAILSGTQSYVRWFERTW